jgi:hypothetical protein
MGKIRVKGETSFFSTKCAPFLLKIGEDFNIDVRRAKGLQLMIFF